MVYKKFLRGLISYVPVLKNIIPDTGTGGSDSAEYCFNMWISHSSVLSQCGVKFPVKSVGEIGPGDSVGIGLAALLSGTENYVALDSIAHSSLKNNLTVFDELLSLFKKGNNLIPIEKSVILKSLTEEKISIIKKALNNLSDKSGVIKYCVPWWERHNINENSIDLILSNAVMEHVVELESAYSNMYKWLKPGGYCSHQIDYRAHELSNIWYQHWEYSDLIWKILMHGRKYAINRMPHSAHKQLMINAGFEIIKEIKNKESLCANRNTINPVISNLFNDEDLCISTSHFIIRKPGK